ncbi:MAG: hypothetical protein LUG99_01610 [Lachnospiraceae bacterium]|nr:hypothetical protein [Lachnospiraceae bacterium]
MIPKIVHYCWFGHNEKPALINKCIESWHKYLPDWEFKEWNEENYDVTKAPYMKAAYDNKKWAFVADYARFDILNQYGGVYFDTDVELLKPIPEDMLEHEAFTGFQSNNRVNPGLVYGSIANQSGVKRMLEVYNNWKFEFDSSKKPLNILDAFTEAFTPAGLELNGKYQIVDGVVIYPNEIFCCYDFETASFDVKEETVSLHHFYASWMPWRTKVKRKCIRILVRIMGKERYAKVKSKIKNI